jgi:hypothetical protein
MQQVPICNSWTPYNPYIIQKVEAVIIKDAPKLTGTNPAAEIFKLNMNRLVWVQVAALTLANMLFCLFIL